ncbi:MAG: hypothetical protein SV760_02525, partial [Halobacteria archaeon]|nr:hypothetical protein [Halobacteria archaeon]
MDDIIQGRRIQFFIDALYGVVFIVGLGALMVSMNMVVAGFVGGLMIGYIFHVWEKMVTYEKVLKHEVSREAERQVSQKADETVEKTVEEKTDETVEEKVEEKVEETVEEKTDETVKEKVEEEVEETVEEKVEEKVEKNLEG